MKRCWSILAAALVLSTALGSRAAADFRTTQPQLTRALETLRLAQVTLTRITSSDHSGQRALALRNVTQAITQVQAELVYNRAHPNQ
jgi:hypothetical protein